jgi:hypothetical protein
LVGDGALMLGGGGLGMGGGGWGLRVGNREGWWGRGGGCLLVHALEAAVAQRVCARHVDLLTR